jgi:hypothetical protein
MSWLREKMILMTELMSRGRQKMMMMTDLIELIEDEYDDDE